jgi:hypothetical protein
MLSKILCALVAGLVMLTNTEAQGLAIHGLSPQLRATLGSIAGNRPVILARCTYADYLLANGDFSAQGTPVMSFTFPGKTIMPGMQIRAVLGGLYINTTGVAKTIGVFMRITGANGVTQRLGFTANVASLAGIRAWRAEIILAASIAGAKGQYVPTIQNGANTQGNTYTTQLAPNLAVAFTEFSSVFVTDTNYAFGQDVGGVILNATPLGSGLSSNLFQQTYDAQQNIKFEVILPQSGLAPTEMTVSSGYMEAL